MTLDKILEKLIAYRSITPLDAGCQDFMLNYLAALGFNCQQFNCGNVRNFFARFGDRAPLLVYAGHTDVVPVGDERAWQTPPFTLTIKNGEAFGRGTADMKGSLAAMLVMAEQFVKQQADSPAQGSLGFLITSAEEGDEFDKGTPFVMQALQNQGIKIDYCVVGEPSSTKILGDTIKVGRRGSLSCTVECHGLQGHVAYPHLAHNPIHLLLPQLSDLVAIPWDKGNAFFPPTSFQITDVQAGGIASNVIPGLLTLKCNWRFSNQISPEDIKALFSKYLSHPKLKIAFTWRLNGMPFLTPSGKLLQATQEAIHKVCGQQPELSTGGGTSDGRFIAPYGVELIELGPINASIHQANEHVSMNDLDKLSVLYLAISTQLLT
ncbi:MAG: succinyl-diaminopimelate desuccinylase [Legionellaceae bacterium]|nr:succinyl-diaminopimelate desuccinylase [Legionellaceae bacterium]|tara:strand:- start:259 stop:1392 length:1134 start_codon:yes stop_codon:yes gene_type:complete